MVNNLQDSASTSLAQTKEKIIPKKSKDNVKHPIALAIDTFLHRVRDIEALAKIYIPLSIERKKKQFLELAEEMERGAELLKDDNQDESQAAQVVAMTKILDAIRRLDRLKQSNVPKMLESSLFLGMFSAYDAFTGDLLSAIYLKKPELFKMVNRSVPVSEILQYDSFDALKDNVLQSEIETFRRKSYVEQFDDLQSTFGIKLKGFPNWPHFVECGQRRNLITHCGGIVSEQYLSVCRKEGYKFGNPVDIGDKLKLGTKYLLSSCELMIEVGLKLGQTLWRKLFPTELKEAEEHLTDAIYNDCLRAERWARAIVFGEFAISQDKFSSDVTRKIAIINYAIGIKFSSRTDETKAILAGVDWSATLNDFKLAEAVLLDSYDSAASIMEKIGERGEIVTEHAYHQWPLFHEFRKTAQFLKTYENIYGYPFVAELQRNADKVQAVTSEEIRKQEQEVKALIADEASEQQAEEMANQEIEPEITNSSGN